MAKTLPRQGACGCATHSSGRKAVAVDPEIKSANLKRLRRIEGQIRGLQNMVADDRYCPDILVQLSAVQEALRAVGSGLMSNHLRHCVAEGIRKGTSERSDGIYRELLDLIYKHSR